MRHHVFPLLLALVPLVGFAATPPPETSLPPRDTVAVFVAWGSSNSCNPGQPLTGTPPNDQPASPSVSSRVGKEWFAWATSGTASVRTLESPVPTRLNNGASGNSGSWWPQLALTYNEITDRVVFMSSAAKGATAEQWQAPNGSLYREGLLAIERAMAAARDHFHHNTVIVFGGVLWNLGPGLSRGDVYPWNGYRAELHEVLQHFGTDVVARWGGRFYLLNTVIPGHETYPDPETDYGLDLEADVCDDYAYCSAIRESVYTKLQQIGCMDDAGATDLCGGWYAINYDYGAAGVHWGQTSLNHIGRRAGEVMAAAAWSGRTAGSGGGAQAASVTLPDGALLDVGEVQPNPTSATAEVPFMLGAEARVEAVLYDVLGRRVAVLAEGAYGAGRHAAAFDGVALPPGVFVLHVTAHGDAGSTTAVRRITLAR